MKTPTVDWENSSDEFITAFRNNPSISDTVVNKGSAESIIAEDVARAQRMSASGLRHLAAILGANRNAGRRERWRKDALAPRYFGKTSSVANMRAVHRRLERAHRRLRDDRLHIRMRPQSARPGNSGRNTGAFLSPKHFQLFPAFASQNDEMRAGIIIHELLHEWLIDQSIGGNTVYEDDEVRRLASRDPAKARRCPSNFENFLLQVWRDEGLEAPSGAIKRDTPLIISAEARTNATGLLADRPVITEATMQGRRDLIFAALRARSDNTLVPTIFEIDSIPLERRGGDNPTGAISYPASACTLPDGTIITAVRGENSRRMKLIAWSVSDETPHRVHDSGTIYGDVYSQPDIIATGGRTMAVIFKGKSGKMKVDLVEYRRNGTFDRIANAETSGPIDDHGRACLVSPVDDLFGGPQDDSPRKVLLATAMRTREGKLSVNLWTGELGRKRVYRHGGLVDRKITGRPGIASLALDNRPRVVAAVRDEDTGRLRLTSYDVSDPARPRRMGDNGITGPRMTHSPDIATVMEGFEQRIATAIRYSETGQIIVSTWAAPDDTTGFVRHRHSGSDRRPRIESTPCLVATVGHESEDLTTAAIGADGRLALQHWSAGDPVRTNG